MTREEIENIPKNVNTLLGLSVTMHTRQKLDEILNKVCELAIKTLEQEPKTGRWIPGDDDFTWKCSKCGKCSGYSGNRFSKPKYKYCPNCGAKMKTEVSE